MKIRIDLVPLRPGGANGGAGVLVHYLLNHLDEITDGDEVVLLTAPWNHDELTSYARSGVRLLQVVPGDKSLEAFKIEKPPENPVLTQLEALRHRLPVSVVRRVLPFARRVKAYLLEHLPLGPVVHSPAASVGDKEEEAGILFCPFTAVTYAEPGEKVVSLFHDLQHREYPQFFSGEQIIERDGFMARAAERADVILCVSNFTRQMLYSHFPAAREKDVRVIPVSIYGRLAKLTPSTAALDRPGLAGRPYLFYPANFWPHKNHEMLLTAFGMFTARHPESDYHLVFTGSLAEESVRLKTAAERMGLQESVHFLGYLPEVELAAVYRDCLALIFPSLFEGFGIPLLEAFIFGKPVLCSRAASLPEVGGDAAIYFDPRKPADMLQAIERLAAGPATLNSHADQTAGQLKRFTPEKMLEGYRDVFSDLRHHAFL